MNKNTILIVLLTVIAMFFVWKISEQQRELSNSIKIIQRHVERLDAAVDKAITSQQMSGHLIGLRGNINKILRIVDPEGLQK